MNQKHVRSKFERLGRFYILALSGIAAIIIISQVLIQNFIASQQDDSHVINVAGRQRMLSQRIAKAALLISQSESLEEMKQHADELKNVVDLWETSHNGLLKGDTTAGLKGKNSRQIEAMFETITPYYITIVENSRALIARVASRSTFDEPLQVAINELTGTILRNEGPFLAAMDDIVSQYDKEARARVDKLSVTELILVAISLSIIILEFIFIFQPTARNVNQTIKNLAESELSSNQMAHEINRLYVELGKSYQDLEAIKVEPKSYAVLCKTRDDGAIYWTSEFMREKFVDETTKLPESLFDFFKQDGHQRDAIEGVKKLLSEGKTWTGEMKFTEVSGDFLWLDLTITPTTNRTGSNELMVVGRDITDVKEAQMMARELNREKIEKSVNELRYRSVLILEGQEEERSRLAKELHDGIGQMLTAMKMNLDSVSLTGASHNRQRLDDIKHFLNSVMKEVRRVSFNLAPSSLSDFGLVPAVRKFCTEVNKVSEIEVEFVDKTQFINRLENNIEMNIYRIVQEGVNNAIKYSGAKKITITFSHNPSQLTISIVDDGKGFDYKQLAETGHFTESGHGIFNMKERAAFVDADFQIESEKGTGTHIAITVPI
ncbi:type IV pili methyl-accepting chemotaxis transducer N-terminal domain-containing protein [uncultured Imperialibacter sp.]|uniref:sensor histidine kinase n=1 Tax=uncultured Imperialibacter sp. TaxID=1672639 RepID=UPI0030D9AD4B|tara:strand:- start:13139 stop:14956 length:1818 start_codon:yes stop_codon:yes gene_type:complete